MVVQPLRALLKLVLISTLVGPVHATRPSYAPTSKSVYVKGGLLQVYLEYDNFQGYFLNYYTMPAGARAAAAPGRLSERSVQGSPGSCAAGSVRPARAFRASPRPAGRFGRAGSTVKDEFNVTWWIQQDIVVTTQPVSAADQDRLRAPRAAPAWHAWHGLRHAWGVCCPSLCHRRHAGAAA
jgi:hypothetical protein